MRSTEFVISLICYDFVKETQAGAQLSQAKAEKCRPGSLDFARLRFAFVLISLDRNCVITQILRNEVEVDKNVLDMKLLCMRSTNCAIKIFRN